VPKVRAADYIESDPYGGVNNCAALSRSAPRREKLLCARPYPRRPERQHARLCGAAPPLLHDGDNRDNSADSRADVGYVPAENIEGKAVVIFFSTDGSAQWWELWKWPWSIRYDRLLTSLTEPLRFSGLEERLGHVFKDGKLLERALTHASASSEASYERLEFLGDACWASSSRDAVRCLSEDSEGMLALKYNALVRGETCATAAEGAGSPTRRARRIRGSQRRTPKDAILGGVCEAVIARCYLDAGF